MSLGTGYYAWNRALADEAHANPPPLVSAAPVTNSAAGQRLGEYERVKHWERIYSSSMVSIASHSILILPSSYMVDNASNDVAL